MWQADATQCVAGACCDLTGCEHFGGCFCADTMSHEVVEGTCGTNCITQDTTCVPAHVPASNTTCPASDACSDNGECCPPEQYCPGQAICCGAGSVCAEDCATTQELCIPASQPPSVSACPASPGTPPIDFGSQCTSDGACCTNGTVCTGNEGHSLCCKGGSMCGWDCVSGVPLCLPVGTPDTATQCSLPSRCMFNNDADAQRCCPPESQCEGSCCSPGAYCDRSDYFAQCVDCASLDECDDCAAAACAWCVATSTCVSAPDNCPAAAAPLPGNGTMCVVQNDTLSYLEASLLCTAQASACCGSLTTACSCTELSGCNWCESSAMCVSAGGCQSGECTRTAEYHDYYCGASRPPFRIVALCAFLVPGLLMWLLLSAKWKCKKTASRNTRTRIARVYLLYKLRVEEALRMWLEGYPRKQVRHICSLVA